jgi:RNA polymerase sigma-70 factor (ECF subfamily)
MHLPVIQRSAVVMLDVLEYSLAETVEMLESTLPAVKAAAHRGRLRLRVLAAAGDEAWDKVATSEEAAGLAAISETSAAGAKAWPATAAASARAEATATASSQAQVQSHSQGHALDRLRAYADAFNARDFDTLRNLLAEDVKLDLVNRTRLAGSKNVSVYFTRYSERHDLKVAAGYAEGRPALLFFNALDRIEIVKFVVFIEWDGEEIKSIQDFNYADYIADGLVARRA